MANEINTFAQETLAYISMCYVSHGRLSVCLCVCVIQTGQTNRHTYRQAYFYFHEYESRQTKLLQNCHHIVLSRTVRSWYPPFAVHPWEGRSQKKIKGVPCDHCPFRITARVTWHLRGDHASGDRHTGSRKRVNSESPLRKPKQRISANLWHCLCDMAGGLLLVNKTQRTNRTAQTPTFLFRWPPDRNNWMQLNVPMRSTMQISE